MNKTKSKLAFIVLCWNNEGLLEECFASIKAQTYKNCVTVFVDNGSSDNSVAVARAQLEPHDIIIETGNNLGFAQGNNVGIERILKDSEVQYIALLNTDARLEPDWSQTLIDFTIGKSKIACLQGTTLDYYNHSVIDSTHIYVAHNSQATQGNWRVYYESEFGPKKVFGVNAAACIVTRQFIERQPFKDLFDNKFFMYLEDVDVAARATVLGWDNYIVPGARAYHMGSASSGKNPGFSLYMTFRNNSAMLVKNFPLKLIFRMLPRLLRSDLDTVRALRRTNRKDASYKVIKGRLAGLCRLPLYIGKRRAVRKQAVLDTEYLWHLMKKGY
jgi:GT2 family glycosyltransferase